MPRQQVTTNCNTNTWCCWEKITLNFNLFASSQSERMDLDLRKVFYLKAPTVAWLCKLY